VKNPPAHKWLFSSRFRRQAYAWHSSSLAVQRVKEAVREIRNAAGKDPLLGAEGAVLFLEKVSPALEQVDSSSGAIGSAVNQAIEGLVSLIVAAPADDHLRDRWQPNWPEAGLEPWNGFGVWLGVEGQAPDSWPRH
jgi:hypothetical protein